MDLECTDKTAATLGNKNLDNDLLIKPVVSHVSFKIDDFWTVWEPQALAKVI